MPSSESPPTIVALTQIPPAETPSYQAAGGAAAPEEGAGAAILVVDDLEANLAAFTAVLGPLAVDLRARLLTARSADEALRHVLVEGERLAVIVLDVNMPGTDGPETARLIRSRTRTEHVPVIFVTALDADRRRVTLGYQSGAVDYLCKPLEPDVLAAKVRAFVDLHRSRHQAAARARRRFADLAAAAERAAASAERAASASAARLAAVLESLPDGVSVFDERWRWTYVNAAAKEVLQRLGVDPEQVAGRELWSTIPALRGTTFEAAAMRAAAERRVVSFEEYFAPLDAWFDQRFVPSDDGSVTTFSRDVTARARLFSDVEAARARAEEAQAAAEEAARAKSEFLSGAHHELRQPLHSQLGLIGLLELGLPGPLTEQQRDILARLKRATEHLLGLVNDVLDLGKLEAGQLTLLTEAATARDVVGFTVALMLPQAEARDVRLRDECAASDGAAVTFLGDEHRVRQIVVNLLSNAVKFTPAGGQVTISCERVARAPGDAPLDGAGPWARIVVEDTGIGISPPHQARIFDAFVQADQSRTRTVGGTGLGLTVSRRLARLMGGDLVLERSAPGEGARFALWLPAPE